MLLNIVNDSIKHIHVLSFLILYHLPPSSLAPFPIFFTLCISAASVPSEKKLYYHYQKVDNIALVLELDATDEASAVVDNDADIAFVNIQQHGKTTTKNDDLKKMVMNVTYQYHSWYDCTDDDGHEHDGCSLMMIHSQQFDAVVAAFHLE